MTIFFQEPCSTMFPFLPPRCVLAMRLFRSYYIRLRMCAATASIDRIELHASLTNWMWDSRNRTVSLFSRFDNFEDNFEECCNSIYGAFNANQWRKIKLGSFASIWKKDQLTDLESGKKSSHKEGAQRGKLTVRKTCNECLQRLFYLYRRWWFLLRPFFDWNATTTKLLGNFKKDLP